MRLGLIFLVLAYILSQFYRAFLAVLAPALGVDIGADAEALSRASGIWFLTFALMQVPVGWALDHIGPRRTAAWLLAAGGGGGAAFFAVAATPGQLQIAMALIAVGCSPVYMASCYIFVRTYRVALFATLAAGLIGVGSIGNLAGSAPLAMAAEAFGWRATVAAVAAITLVIALALLAFAKDPERADQAGTGSFLDILKLPALWPIMALMAVQYAPAAGIRGLWVGPYFADTFGPGSVAGATLVMALAMIAGNFAYGPLDRLLGTRKWVVFGGNSAGAAALILLWALPAPGLIAATALFAAVGFFGASFGVAMAHGRALFPAHLAGRGVTLMNLCGIGGVGVMQIASGQIHAAAGAGYSAVFLFFGLTLAAGCLVYLLSQDRVD